MASNRRIFDEKNVKFFTLSILGTNFFPLPKYFLNDLKILQILHEKIHISTNLQKKWGRSEESPKANTERKKRAINTFTRRKFKIMEIQAFKNQIF